MVRGFAKWLGIDSVADEDLLYLAAEGARAPVPVGWKACQTAEAGLLYLKTLHFTGIHPAAETFSQEAQDKKREKYTARGHDPRAQAQPEAKEQPEGERRPG